MTTCLAITTLSFISTAVIFWAPNFAENVLKGDRAEVLTVFVTVCVTGPVLGVIIGGALVQKYAGGYEGKHASTFAVIYGGLALSCALPIKQIDNIYTFGLCLWGVLFFGGGVIPNIQGIMISSLNTDLRAPGNSISNIMQNAFGYLPAPFIYGVIYKYTKSYDQKLAFAITLWYTGVGVLFMAISLYYRFKLISSSVLLTETLTTEVENKVKVDINKVDNIFKKNSNENSDADTNNSYSCKAENVLDKISSNKLIQNGMYNSDLDKNNNSNKIKANFFTECSSQSRSQIDFKDKDSTNNLGISLNKQEKRNSKIIENLNLCEQEIIAEC